LSTDHRRQRAGPGQGGIQASERRDGDAPRTRPGSEACPDTLFGQLSSTLILNIGTISKLETMRSVASKWRPFYTFVFPLALKGNSATLKGAPIGGSPRAALCHARLPLGDAVESLQCLTEESECN